MMQRVILIMLCCYSFWATAADTVLKFYRPFGEIIDQAAPVIKETLQGTCPSQSHLILREDAWRCQIKDKIYDPCFVKSGNKQKTAICPQSPWMEDSVQIVVSEPFNNEHHISLDMSQAFPWGIELINGEYCQAIETNEIYDTMPIRYRCSKEHLLIGYLQRCKTVWSMLEKTPQGVDSVNLKRVWF